MSALIISHWPLKSYEVPQGWELVSLSQFVADIQTGFASGKHNSEGHGVPHLRPMNISPRGEIDLADGRFVDPDKSPLRLKRGDVLFNNTNSPAWVGKTAYINTESELAFSNHMTRLRMSDGINARFAAEQLQFLCRSGYFLQQCKKHVNQASINRSFLSDSTPFMLPPLADQSRIVSAIKSLQERSSRARELLSEVGPLIGQLRQSVLRDAFSGKLTADWRAENPDVEPASELLKRVRTERRERWEAAERAKYEAKGKQPTKNWKDKYKEPEPVDESELPELPVGWSWEALEAMVPSEFPIVYGIIQAGPNIPDGVPYIRPADIKNSEIDFNNLLRTTPEIAAKYGRATLKAGDLIYSVVGTTGKTLIADERLDGANITQSSVRIRMLEPFNSQMILHALQSPLVTRQMDSLQFGVAVQRLNVEHMRRLAIPVPPIEEWKRISEAAEASFAKLERVETEVASINSSLTQLDQSTLSKAFRGELVAQDPNDEPASELLKRIRASREAATAKKNGNPSTRRKKGKS